MFVYAFIYLDTCNMRCMFVVYFGKYRTSLNLMQVCAKSGLIQPALGLFLLDLDEMDELLKASLPLSDPLIPLYIYPSFELLQN